MPPRGVLFAVASHQTTGPALPAGHPFSNVFQGYYWTDDSSSRFPSQAWHVHLGGGRIPRAGKADSFLVWPVSLPETKKTPATQSGEQRFSIRDGGILDSLTGLVWSRNADIATGPMTWKQGLAAVAELNRQSPEGIRDWRMPNIRELESLISLKDHSPALPPEHPFTQIRDAYWSSTTSVYEPTYAWTLSTRDGMVGVGFKTTPGFYLWPVRGKAFFTVVPYPL